jgi:hypothetical protein
MKKFIKYNTQIFLSWFFYIALGYKLPREAIELIKIHYTSTLREKRLLERIERKNKKEKGWNRSPKVLYLSIIKKRR